MVVINHTGFLDFALAGLPFWREQGRFVRFMAKQEVFTHRVMGPAMRAMHHIPVDRAAGAASFRAAVEALRAGELVGIFPEATISRSFCLKEFKSGATRMARLAGVPLIPVTLWGSQRVWTKDHPKNLGRRKLPITAAVGPQFEPSESVPAAMAQLRETMTALLHQVQENYPHPAGEYWVPRRLGGSAPTLDEASAIEEAELLERARRRAEPS